MSHSEPLVPKGAAFFPVPACGPTQDYVFILVPGFTLLAFSSAVEPLRIANQLSQQPLYRWRVLSETGAQVASSSGIAVAAETALEPLDNLVCFAVKSNSNIAVLKLLGDLGAGMDVVSIGEYHRAKAAGVRMGRKDLVAQGRHVELYQGVEAWFGEIEGYVKAQRDSKGVTIKHYLVSSGLTEIIEGTKIYKNFANVFASEYWFDAYDLPFPKRVITDTGKTQYMFRINKGIEDLGESINSHMPEDARPIPFSNMIYFGDGDTDVPSMALLKKNGGHAIAVHTPKASADKCIGLFNAGRCDFYAPADYRKGSDLFKRTCLLLDRMIADIRVEEERSGLGG